MARRHNQYRNRVTRERGHEDQDLADKNRVKKIMEGHGYTCQFNLYLLTARSGDALDYMFVGAVTETMLERYKLAARPDVVCIPHFDPDDDPSPAPVIIEVDGAVHRKELDARDLYLELGIAQIILNKQYLELEGITWEAWIADGLATIKKRQGKEEASDA